MGARLPHSESKLRGGFTLIELSIVLVIIGLIVGGVLVGKDLITAATLRSQISQIEKYNTATRTFELKYGYLPGDIPDPAAQSFGFAGRGSFAGEGDGNGLLEGVNFDLAGWSSPANQGTGETVMFWSDLSIAHMIDGDFSAASSTVSAGLITGTDLSKWFPSAKIGRRNSIYVHSIGPNGVYGQNYFGISAISKMNDPFNGWMQSAPALTVSEAYNIDNKIDDGLPQSGTVNALYIGYPATCCGDTCYPWAAGGGNAGAGTYPGVGVSVVTTDATPGSTTTCFDNGNIAGVQKYSVGQNNGTGVNCALSLRFQ